MSEPAPVKTDLPVVATPTMYQPIPAVLITIFTYFAAQILAAILVYSIPTVSHWSHARQDAWTANPWIIFAFIFTAEAFTLGILHRFMKPRLVTFRSLGLNKPKLKYLGYALLAYGCYFLLYLIILGVSKALIPSLNLDQKQDFGFSQNSTGLALLPIFLSLVILPPITEEIVMRGFLLNGLRTKMAFIPAAIITSLLFAAAHLAGGGSNSSLLWVAAIDTFVLSMVLCYLRVRTGSLWPGIGVHMMKNMIAFFVLYNLAQYIR